MRLRINLRLRAALIAASSLLLSYTIPDAQAEGVAVSKDALSVPTLTELNSVIPSSYPRKSAYQLEEVTGEVTQDLFSIVKYVFNEVTGEITPVYYNVTFTDTLGNYGGGDTKAAQYNFELNENTGQLITVWKSTADEPNPDINGLYTRSSRLSLGSTAVGYTGSIFGAAYNNLDFAIFGNALTVRENLTGGDIKGDYINNVAIADNIKGGAAHFRGSVLGDLIGNFISNRATVETSTFGGAVHIENTSFNNITGDYIANTIFAVEGKDGTFSPRGGAVSMDGSSAETLTGDFIRNAIISYNHGGSKNGYGAALYVNGKKADSIMSVAIITGDYTENFIKLSTGADKWVSGHGGAIAINEGAVVGNIVGDFTGNYVMSYGINKTAFMTSGAIGVYSSSLSTLEGNFTANYTHAVSLTKSEAIGGALRVAGSYMDSITGDFHSNYVSATADNEVSYSYGGAIINTDATIKNIMGSFYNNYAAADYIASGTTSLAQGGAIYNADASIGLLALYDRIIFKGNYVMSLKTGEKVYNAIYNKGNSNIHFNAYSSDDDGVGEIHVYDTISGDAATQETQNIHINSNKDGSGALMPFLFSDLSDVLFYNEVSNQNITVYAGTLKLRDFTGSGDIPAAHAMLINSSLTVDSEGYVDAGSASYLGSGNSITNNGNITLGAGTLSSTIAGSGDLTINLGNSVTADISNIASTGSTKINGTLELTGTGDSTTSYTGDGTLRITTGSSMTSSVEKVSVANVDVDGTFELTGTGNLTSSYTGDGTLRIATDGNITTAADKLIIDDINVNGTLTLNGGTLNAALMYGPSFTGDGKLVIAAEQTVTMEKSPFTSSPSLNVATTEVNGTLALSAADVYTKDDFTINGTLSIVGGVSISGSLKGEGSINISASTQLSMDANAIASSEGLTINNSGTLKLRGTGSIDRTIGGSGLISLLSGDDLTTRADFYGTTNRIDSSYGILRLTTGTLTHLISGSTDIYIHSGNTVTTSIDTFNYNTKNDFFIEGTLALTGTGTLSKILDDDVYFATLGAGTVQITEGSDITADLYYLKSNIELDGDLTITNINYENKLMAAVTGTGTLTVNEGTQKFHTSADYLRMDTLHNDGTITLSNDITKATTAGTLDTILLGTGEVIIEDEVAMHADVLNTTNTITNKSTIVLTGGTLNKSVEGGGALEILSGASVSMGDQYLDDYYKITTDGALLITGGGTIAKNISGEGYVTINAPTTLGSTITSGFGAIIDETNSGSLHVTSTGSIIGIGSYALNLTGDISLADRFITWDDKAGMLDRESLQASFQLTYNGQYSPFVNITQDGNSYSLSVYEVGAYNPLSGYYLEAKADGVSGNAFVLSDYIYGSAADAESYVKFRGTMGDDYSQGVDPSLKSRAASYVWRTDAEGNVYLDELSTHSDAADVYAFSRNNEEVAFWKWKTADWDENPAPEFKRSFIGFKDGDLQAFFFASEWRTVGLVDGDFIDNSHSKYSLYSPAYGGAMHLSRNVTVTKVNSNFVGNRAHHTDSTTTGGFDTRGGAIYAHSSNIGDIVGNFIGNAAYSYSQHETGTVLTTSHKAEGGAIFLDEDASIGTITGNFVGNYAVSRNDNYRFEYYKASGGALRLQVGATIDSIEGNFTQNYSSAGHFATGGAISLISKANIKNITGNFYGNYATTQVPGSESILPGGEFEVKWAKGGAISVEDGHISNIAGDFEKNKAISSQDSQGGAIHMDDLKGEQRDITIVGNFKGNASIADEDAYGGAMFYHDFLLRSISYDATVAVYMDLQYISGLVEITGDFIGNYASGKDHAYGGAIYNHGGEISILAEEKDSSVLFEGNYTTLDGGETKEYNAIHNTARNNEFVDAAPAVVNFEATGGNVIVVNDSIDGYSTELASDLHLRNWQVLNINLKANAAGAKGDYSRVEFNNHVSDQTVNVYGGELRLGNDGRTRTTTPSSMLQRVNLTVFNTARVEAVSAESLGNGDNNILITEKGYINLQAGKLSNDITADMEGIIQIQKGVTIDSILTIKDSANIKGSLNEVAKLQNVTLGVNSEINGQAIAMEHGVLELTTTGAVASTTVDGHSMDYITVSAKADISEISGSLTLRINSTSKESAFNDFINGLHGRAVVLEDYFGISTDVFTSNFDIEKSLFINLNGSSISVTAAHNQGGSLLLVLIPEPSTATLSLLALTGLVMRRRRSRA